MKQPGRRVPRNARRIVVKLGSSVLTLDGELRRRVFGDIARQVSGLFDDGREVVVVTSGAIAMGSHTLGWTQPGGSIPEKQAAAAVGQIGLISLYQRRFARFGRQVGQVLVTRAGLEDRERFLNARKTLLTLLRMGVVPVVNENDTVATDEIRFGDNDNLSATVVNLVEADLLLLLTDVDGMYTRAPVAGEPRPPLLDVIQEITPEVLRAASGPGSAFGRGGMATKLEAAQTAARSGAATVVCNGRARDVLLRVTAGEPLGTLFLPGARMRSRKHWLAFTARPRGELVVDDGAVRALRERGRSLLPAGVVQVRGSFGVGDAVSCVSGDGEKVARGLVAYAAADIERIKGLSTRQIGEVLGYSNGDEVIHRDDLVVEATPSEAASRSQEV